MILQESHPQAIEPSPVLWWLHDPHLRPIEGNGQVFVDMPPTVISFPFQGIKTNDRFIVGFINGEHLKHLTTLELLDFFEVGAFYTIQIEEVYNCYIEFIELVGSRVFIRFVNA